VYARVRERGGNKKNNVIKALPVNYRLIAGLPAQTIKNKRHTSNSRTGHSAVRIWSMDSWSSLIGKGSVDSITGASSKESVIVLVGQKRGLPVFDVDWNRDGRTLISAGGDGSLMTLGYQGSGILRRNHTYDHSKAPDEWEQECNANEYRRAY
jgi:hypothetical protein